ncbi:hypothetical protein KQ304_10950 [Synechococcus sp. CS-1329]|uniref:hypothetical protein n=1 Tax=Synechococcus sp. CS-1329 TaxID=2847975 RepID=UPI00223BBC79|nr:hypothetical protein [Synechococcus sp. CS-1329]MCT0219505.1 hypothetical protein [Synechococcus sp. CS-1329]
MNQRDEIYMEARLRDRVRGDNTLITPMDGATAAWIALIAALGLGIGASIVEDSKKGSPLELFGAILTLVGAGCSVIMIFQGFHLWNMGYQGIPIESKVAGSVATKARGKGGIVLIAIQFLPQFLVFFFGAALWCNKEAIRYSADRVGFSR